MRSMLNIHAILNMKLCFIPAVMKLQNFIKYVNYFLELYKNLGMEANHDTEYRLRPICITQNSFPS